MRWESSGVVGFDLGPLLQGQMRIAKLKTAYNLLIIGPRGFGALSLRWIQFAFCSDALGLVLSVCLSVYSIDTIMYARLQVLRFLARLTHSP